MKKYLVSTALALTLTALPGLALAECGSDEDFGAYIRQIEGGGKGYEATNPGSSATGAYQFLIGTLKELGYVQHYSGPASSYFGDSGWNDVVWTGKDGINSRAEFMASQGAQDRAFAEFTQRNLQAVAGNWTPGETVNGIQMTSGGVAAATHMLGVGGFRQWAASGFSASGLDPKIAAAHGWSPEQYNKHLMNRVAKDGCMDPNDITIGNDAIAELPEIFLMPFTAKPGKPVIIPGRIASVL